MADNFDTTEMSNVLEAISGATRKQPIGAPASKEEAIAKAREHKWVEPQKYDYSIYNKQETDAGTDTVQSLRYEWASSAGKYEWNDEYGDVGPRVPELEKELFNDDLRMKHGDNFSAFEFQVLVEGPVKPDPVMRFEDAAIHPLILENIKLCQYPHPTPIQAYCIPAVLSGHDLVACAQTGSGKTAAYLIPVLSQLAGKIEKLAAPRPSPTTFNPATDRVRAEPLVLIVAPTRELATQIFDETRRLCYRTMFRPCVVYGGGPRGMQQRELQRGCDILIATPGRLKDFMDRPQVLSLNRVKFTIVDEADEMLHGDWEEDMRKIMSGGDNNEDSDHRYMMFSATFPKEARILARDYMTEDYLRIRVGRAGSTHTNISQTIYYVDDHLKRDALYDLLFSMPPARTLIFVRSKREADLVDDFLYNKGLPSTSIHSDRTQREREDAMIAFRSAKAPILVTTGVAARGLDIKNVMHVINFDLPSNQHGGIDEYIHRIGRTARIGNAGLATSFFNDRNEDIADDLVKVLIETKQQVPDFLQNRIPADNAVHWDDDSGDENGTAATTGGADGSTWGGATDSGIGANADGAAAEEDHFKVDDSSW